MNFWRTFWYPKPGGNPWAYFALLVLQFGAAWMRAHKGDIFGACFLSALGGMNLERLTQPKKDL